MVKTKAIFVLTKGVGTCNDGTLSPFVPLGRGCYEEINLKAESIVVIAVHVPFLMRKHMRNFFFRMLEQHRTNDTISSDDYSDCMPCTIHVLY